MLCVVPWSVMSLHQPVNMVFMVFISSSILSNNPLINEVIGPTCDAGSPRLVPAIKGVGLPLCHHTHANG